MTDVVLKLQPLTAEAFAPFGDVLEVRDSNDSFPINYGLTQRHHKLAQVDVGDGFGIINIFRSNPVELPLRIKLMERHPLGSQSFTPLSGNPYVVIVAQAGEAPEALRAEKLHAFLATPEQGVNYHKGTWHHYCLTLNETSNFLVVDRGGEGHNCDEVVFDDALTVTVSR